MENKQSLFNLREKFSELNINEVETNHAVYIPESKTNKIFNSIAKIIVENAMGTGFFMKFKLENKFGIRKSGYFDGLDTIYFLVTCEHIVQKKDVDSKVIIKICYGKINEEIIKEINLNDNKRFIKCFDSPVDITLIQIIGEDCIPENKFLIPDFSYKNNSGFNYYLNKDFYSAGYPGDKKINGERVICSGKIKEVKNFEFAHTLDTKNGSSGSPICSVDDGKVIGIHKSGIKQIQINYGTFIGFIINDFEKPYMGQRQSSIKDFPFNGQNIHQIKLTSKEVEQIIKGKKVMEKFLKLCHLAEKYALRIGNKENEIEYFGYYCFHSFCKNSSIEELFNILKKENEQFKYIANEFYSKHLMLSCENLKSFAPQIFIKLKSLLKNENEKRIFDDIINFINKIN